MRRFLTEALLWSAAVLIAAASALEEPWDAHAQEVLDGWRDTMIREQADDRGWTQP